MYWRCWRWLLLAVFGRRGIQRRRRRRILGVMRPRFWLWQIQRRRRRHVLPLVAAVAPGHFGVRIFSARAGGVFQRRYLLAVFGEQI